MSAARAFVVSDRFVVSGGSFRARVSAYHEAVWEAFQRRGDLIVFMCSEGKGYIGAGRVDMVDGEGVVVAGHDARRLGWLTTRVVAWLSRFV